MEVNGIDLIWANSYVFCINLSVWWSPWSECVFLQTPPYL